MSTRLMHWHWPRGLRVVAITAIAVSMVSLGSVATTASRAVDTAAPDAAAALSAEAAPADQSPFRTIITSDLNEFPKDDAVSFYRLLLYSNEFADSLEGLIYSSFAFPTPLGAWPTDIFQRIIRDEYSLVYENLREHDPRYPSPEDLESLVMVGNIAGSGLMTYDSVGSLFIKDVLLDDDPRPVWLQAWGGTSTIGAALRSIEEEFGSTEDWEQIKSDVSAKARIYSILDQDAVFKDYIDDTWPDIDIIVNFNQFQAVAYPGFRAERVPEELNAYFQPEFMSEIYHGPMLEDVPVAVATEGGGGPFAVAEEYVGSCFCEGDSPAFFQLVDTGLRSDEDPTYGGWGGRFASTAEHRWSDSPAYMALPEWQGLGAGDGFVETNPVTDANQFDEQYDRWYPQSRWIPALQNDYAARSEWQTASFEEANHPPVVTVEGSLDVSAAPGEQVQLVGAATDPDGDGLAATWWQYIEAGTYDGAVEIVDATMLDGASLAVPDDATPGDTIHVILEVTDDGEIPITRYQRVIVTVI